MSGGQFSIPLRPRDRPVDLPDNYQRTLRNELQVKYLEHIGASPTRANLAMVRKHIQLEKCNFTTAWKSRGWVSDQLYVSLDPPPAAHHTPEAHARANPRKWRTVQHYHLRTCVYPSRGQIGRSEALRPPSA